LASKSALKTVRSKSEYSGFWKGSNSFKNAIKMIGARLNWCALGFPRAQFKNTGKCTNESSDSGQTSPKGKDVKGDKAKGKNVTKGVRQGHPRTLSRTVKDRRHAAPFLKQIFKPNPTRMVRSGRNQRNSRKLQEIRENR
jgi:hypothetical protein